ncbi:MAG: YceI family protein [Thermodesulfobacteriota bacterium]|nr:YceI family protein [Thermodesulfobacteriota bacterium]
MKKTGTRISNFVFFFVLLFFASIVSAADIETYEVDPVHSTAFFKVGHYGFGFVRGGFTDISGNIVIDKAHSTKSTVDIVIKTESINTENNQRDEHLKSKDFFDVAEFPIMYFKSREIKKQSKNLYEVAGEFTLHGITKKITVPVKFIGEGKDHYGAYRAGFETQFSINRSEYGMTKYIPAAGDTVAITLVIEGIRK